MPSVNDVTVAVPPTSNRPHLDLRDATRPDRYENDVAQRHRPGSTLSGVRTERAAPTDRERELTVTSALKLPPSSQLASSWPETPPGADPLPGQLDRWLAARGAELVAIRRHIHAHPERSHHEFETAALIARELAVAGLSPRLLPKGNGVICDIGAVDRRRGGTRVRARRTHDGFAWSWSGPGPAGRAGHAARQGPADLPAGRGE